MVNTASLTKGYSAKTCLLTEMLIYRAAIFSDAIACLSLNLPQLRHDFETYTFPFGLEYAIVSQHLPGV